MNSIEITQADLDFQCLLRDLRLMDKYIEKIQRSFIWKKPTEDELERYNKALKKHKRLTEIAQKLVN
jgi:hypothetical protein